MVKSFYYFLRELNGCHRISPTGMMSKPLKEALYKNLLAMICKGFLIHPFNSQVMDHWCHLLVPDKTRLKVDY